MGELNDIEGRFADELKVGVDRVVRYVHDEGFRGMITSGLSARMVKKYFSLSWNKFYSGGGMPDFFNFGTNKPNPLYDKKKNDGLSLDERKALFESYAKDNFEGLLNLYDEGVLFLDDFVNRGLKADLIVNNLKHYGFENPSFATFIARDEGAEQRMFVGSVNENCYRVIHNFIRTQRELRRFEEKYC